MGFPRQQYWSGLPFPLLGDIPEPGVEPTSPVWAGGFFTTEQPGKPMDINEFNVMRKLLSSPELSAQGLVPLRWGCALPSPNAPVLTPWKESYDQPR